MPIPAFIRAIRAGAGTQLLLLPGSAAVVVDDAGRVLLGRRADTGAWAVVAGIPEPGEQPADAAVREVYEETAVRCAVERVVAVETGPVFTYDNGDRSQYIVTVFRARYVGGEARVNDDESLDVAWFAPDALPPLGASSERWVKHALGGGPAWFAGGGAPEEA
ncbi:NUDIX domain-containing protein [Streptomyces sp. NPDC051940]|uniref:NUDIX hydrolase n=1 Tax=Streptomyces sp. NPDC051940 TaxID=3155675 RepID=UPI0034212BF6